MYKLKIGMVCGCLAEADRGVSPVRNRKREDMGMCEHWECPYNGCKYHEFFDEKKHKEYKERSYKFFPYNEEEMEDCTLYLDV